jgi:hypothetical protein
VAGVHHVLTAAGLPDNLRLWEIAGQAVSLLSAVAATIALWLFAGMTFDWRVAWVGSLLFSVTRNWAVLGADVLSDLLAVAFQLWGAVLALVALRQLQAKRWRMVALAGCVGLCAGLGYLVRPESLLVAILAVGLWLAYQIRYRINWRLTACAAASTLIATAACMAPYVAIIGGLSKKKQLTDFAPAAATNLPAAHGVGALTAVFAVLDKFVRAMHPDLVVMAGIWIAVAIVSSTRQDRPVARLVPRAKWPGLLLILAAGAVVTTMLGLMYRHVHYVSSRHLAFMAALFVSLAGAGAVFVGNMIGTIAGTRQPARWRIGLAATGLAALVAFTVVHACKPLHPDDPAAREAGLYLGGLCTPDDRVVSSNPWVGYYAQRPSPVILVQKGFRLGEVIWLRKAFGPGGVYLVLDDEALRQGDAELKADLHSPRFERVKAFPTDDPGPARVYLYRVHIPRANAATQDATNQAP